ncbi:hypothetical protein Cpir12675_004463, partial [Ceratocystis pirilliformis]
NYHSTTMQSWTVTLLLAIAGSALAARSSDVQNVGGTKLDVDASSGAEYNNCGFVDSPVGMVCFCIVDDVPVMVEYEICLDDD